jgi:hypothetical protein
VPLPGESGLVALRVGGAGGVLSGSGGGVGAEGAGRGFGQRFLPPRLCLQVFFPAFGAGPLLEAAALGTAVPVSSVAASRSA